MINDILLFSPSTLTKLTVQHVDKLAEVPFNIIHLITSNEFNQPVDKLPPTLTQLITGYYFNQPVDKLPSTLTHFTTGYKFN
jgi:hypothetical protein